MDVFSFLRKETIKVVHELYGVAPDEEIIKVEETRPDIEGELTIVVFPLSRFTKKKPEVGAEEIGKYFLENYKEIREFNVVKGFLNLTFTAGFWINQLNNFSDSDWKEDVKTSTPQTIMVEYSSPNTNKPLHLGHIRNNLIGHAVSEALKARGHKLIKANLINDRGIHICKSMLAWIKDGKETTPDNTGTKGDHFVGKYYVDFDKRYKAEVDSLVEKGMDEAEAKMKAPAILEARELLRKWEDNDTETREIWKTMNNWVYKGFDATYDRMGISFDKVYHESDTYLLGKDIVLEGLKKGVFFQKEDRSVWCDLTNDGLDEKILLRPDGTSVYMTQDIGTAELKYQDYKADKSLYIVGNEQDYHFNVLKLILKKLGKEYADSIHHLSYGMVELPEGKMKTREGKVVDADDLMEEMKQTAKAYLMESEKITEMSIEDQEVLPEMIGQGALKFFILRTDIKKNIVFNPQESIEFQGHTGPFIQYTHARIKSIFRKANIDSLKNIELSGEFNLDETEIELVKKIESLKYMLADVEQSYDPSPIAHFAFGLAKSYNKFYHVNQVLKEEDELKKNFRLKLSAAVAEVLAFTMGLLGVQLPEKM